MAQVSGNLVYGVKDDLKKSGKFDLFLSKVSPDTRGVYEGAVLNSKYYPIELWTETIDAMQGFQPITKEYFRDKARAQLKGFFGFVISFLTIDRLLSKTDWLWKKTYKTGNAKSIQINDSELLIEVSDFTFTKNFLQVQEAFNTALIEVIVKKECTSRIKQVTPTVTQFVIKITDKKID